MPNPNYIQFTSEDIDIPEMTAQTLTVGTMNSQTHSTSEGSDESLTAETL